jgi:2'-5' RNA ligase
MSNLSPLILSLKLDDQTFAVVDALRAQHFPPERNFLPAHVTLFHALPGEHEAAVHQTLQAIVADTPHLKLELPRVRLLGKGVALDLECPPLIRLRRRLAAYWTGWLGKQDRQPYHPHITIQNKVMPNEAQQLYHQLAATWQPLEGNATGLLLWRYIGGPWEFVDEYVFAAEKGG